MKVKFKKLNPKAKTPTKAHDCDAGWDIYAVSQGWSVQQSSGLYAEYGTGIALEIPKGYVGLLFPRSSITNTKHMLKNSVGVIDSGYRGEVKLRFTPDDTNNAYMTGNKIGQILFLRLPKIELEESEELSISERNSAGFGSSGK